jgi:hypothetical protein
VKLTFLNNVGSKKKNQKLIASPNHRWAHAAHLSRKVQPDKREETNLYLRETKENQFQSTVTLIENNKKRFSILLTKLLFSPPLAICS